MSFVEKSKKQIKIKIKKPKKIKKSITSPVPISSSSPPKASPPKASSIVIVKPLLKWVGGKTQIMPELMKTFPKKINNYHEIFLGGGSVLFALLSHVKYKDIVLTGKVYASDLNKYLIEFYKHVQNNKDKLLEEVNSLTTNYSKPAIIKGERKPKSLEEALSSRESYYYWIRDKYNASIKKNECSPKVSAMFIFLNKTCFRGVYRMGPNGFNVPFGHYKTIPNVLDKEHLDTVATLIKDVKFQHMDFSNSMKLAIPGDFVYLDPPYAPETKTSFVGYTKDGFTVDKHNELFDFLHEYKKKNIKFIMSNAKVDMVTKSFSSSNYSITDIKCRRAIHSKKPESTTTEVIISSF